MPYSLPLVFLFFLAGCGRSVLSTLGNFERGRLYATFIAKPFESLPSCDGSICGQWIPVLSTLDAITIESEEHGEVLKLTFEKAINGTARKFIFEGTIRKHSSGGNLFLILEPYTGKSFDPAVESFYSTLYFPTYTAAVLNINTNKLNLCFLDMFAVAKYLVESQRQTNETSKSSKKNVFTNFIRVNNRILITNQGKALDELILSIYKKKFFSDCLLLVRQ